MALRKALDPINIFSANYASAVRSFSLAGSRSFAHNEFALYVPREESRIRLIIGISSLIVYEGSDDSWYRVVH